MFTDKQKTESCPLLPLPSSEELATPHRADMTSGSGDRDSKGSIEVTTAPKKKKQKNH